MRAPYILFLSLSLPLLTFAQDSSSEKVVNGVEEVCPTEDLMREHGVLDRVLLIYEEIIRRMDSQQPFFSNSLKRSAEIIRSFIENYHEKLEEDYLFPRFEKAKKMVDLVKTLKEQHLQGRILTDYVLAHANDNELKNSIQQKKLRSILEQFITMYRPHAAREDTVLFPAFKALISKQEYDALGETFEEKEHELFGKDGFNTIVNDVADIEKELGIYKLSQFTPKNQK